MNPSSIGTFFCLSVAAITCVDCGSGNPSSSTPSGIGGAGSSLIGTMGGRGQSQAREVATLSGTSEASGDDDGPGAFGVLDSPSDLTSDGTHLYVVDSWPGYRIRTLDIATGLITTLAGSESGYCQDGVGNAAHFQGLGSITIDPSHQTLYAGDIGGCGIRKIVIATGEVSTLPGTAGFGDAKGNFTGLYDPEGLVTDSTGSKLYVAEGATNQVYVIDLVTSNITSLAGSGTSGFANGVGSAAAFDTLKGIAIDPTDTKLYVADAGDNNDIRVIDIASRQVTTLAAAGFTRMRSLAMDATGSYLYTTDSDGMRKVGITTGTVTTIAGSTDQVGYLDGSGTAARFNGLMGIKVIGDDIYIADSNNNAIRKYSPSTTEVTTQAGSPTPATFHDPVNAVSDGAYLYVVDKDNNQIRKVSVVSGYTTTVYGSGAFGHADGVGTASAFQFPSGIALAGSHLYVADNDNSEIRAIDLATKQVSTLAGDYNNKGAVDGVGTAASFNLPQGLVADPSGQNLYVTDQANHEIRKIVIATGQVTTWAGATESGFVDGLGTAARFNMPANIAIDPQGKSLYVTDASNNAIRKIDIATAAVTTVAGAIETGYKDSVGIYARFTTPWGIVTDGTNVYVADAANDLIRMIDLASSTVTTLCGKYTYGSDDGACDQATFQTPAGLALDPNGSTLYICDSLNNKIRFIRLEQLP